MYQIPEFIRRTLNIFQSEFEIIFFKILFHDGIHILLLCIQLFVHSAARRFFFLFLLRLTNLFLYDFLFRRFFCFFCRFRFFRFFYCFLLCFFRFFYLFDFFCRFFNFFCTFYNLCIFCILRAFWICETHREHGNTDHNDQEPSKDQTSTAQSSSRWCHTIPP